MCEVIIVRNCDVCHKFSDNFQNNQDSIYFYCTVTLLTIVFVYYDIIHE